MSTWLRMTHHHLLSNLEAGEQCILGNLLIPLGTLNAEPRG